MIARPQHTHSARLRDPRGGRCIQHSYLNPRRLATRQILEVGVRLEEALVRIFVDLLDGPICRLRMKRVTLVGPESKDGREFNQSDRVCSASRFEIQWGEQQIDRRLP